MAHSDAARLPQTTSSAENTRKQTILLAEDELAVRSLVTRVLTNHGYNVLSAGNGAEAALLWQQHADEVDLIITDVVMPLLSGRALVQELNQRRNGLKVLYMSGYTEDAIVHHGIKTNGINFIEKPFTPAALLAKARSILQEA